MGSMGRGWGREGMKRNDMGDERGEMKKQISMDMGG